MNKHSCDKQQLKLLTNKRVYIYYRNLGRIRKSKKGVNSGINVVVNVNVKVVVN